MCLTPIRIPNPNRFRSVAARFYKDTTSQYIEVPCGYCSQCIANKQMQIVQRVRMQSLDNHIFFGTLTYNDDMIPSVTTSTGFKIKYADFSDLQKMFKRIRKGNLFGRSFSYMAVSERGSKNGRPHFHMLLFLEKYDTDNWMDIMNLERHLYDVVRSQWCRNVAKNVNGKANNRRPKYVPLFTYKSKRLGGKFFCNYDLHYVTPGISSDGVDDVSFYVSKYLLKPAPKDIRLQQALKLNLSSEEYDFTWKIVKSRKVYSKDFGSRKSPKVQSYIRECLDMYPSAPYPTFYNPGTGQAFPLADFYKEKFFTLDDLDRIKSVFPSRDDNVVIGEVLPWSNINDSLKSLGRIQNQVFCDGDVLDILE